MAQPESRKTPSYVSIDAAPARRLVKRAIGDLEEANRELARLEARCDELETRLLAEYGIRKDTPS